MRTNRILLAGLVPALLLAGAAVAQDVPLDVELGYRWSDVSGNEEMYKSQVNERDGFQVRSLSWGLGDIRGTNAIDHFRIDAYDLGVGPKGQFRLAAGRTGYWKLDASYRRSELYSNMPTIANPFLSQGSLESQHSYDRTREMIDVDLELLPGKAVRPLVGFSYNHMYGPGGSTYHVGQDDFRLSEYAKEHETEYRIGVAFDAGPISGQVVQGWRQFKGEDTLQLTGGAGAGNNPETILGVPVNVSSLSRTGKTDVDTPVTTAVVTGKLGTAVRLTGTYVRAKSEGEDESAENLAGSLVSYDILRYFKTLAEQTSASTEALYWRGSIRADVHLSAGLDVSAGYTRRNRELDGWGLVNDLYGGTTTFSGFDPKDVATLLESNTRMERDEDIFDLRASVKLGEPVTFRLGVVSNSGGDRRRERRVRGGGRRGARADGTSVDVLGIDGGLYFKVSGLTLGVDYLSQTADNVVMRTDFTGRERLRLRGTWEPVSWVRIGATGEQIDTTNKDYTNGIDGKTKTWAGDLEVGPAVAAVPVRVRTVRVGQHDALPAAAGLGRGDVGVRRGRRIHRGRRLLQPQAGLHRGPLPAVRERRQLRVRARPGAGPREPGLHEVVRDRGGVGPRRLLGEGPVVRDGGGLQGQPLRPLPSDPPVSTRLLPGAFCAPASRRGRFFSGGRPDPTSTRRDGPIRPLARARAGRGPAGRRERARREERACRGRTRVLSATASAVILGRVARRLTRVPPSSSIVQRVLRCAHHFHLERRLPLRREAVSAYNSALALPTMNVRPTEHS